MQKHFLEFRKAYINIACSPFILVSNTSELSARYLPNGVEKSISSLEIKNIYNGEFQGFHIRFNFKD